MCVLARHDDAADDGDLRGAKRLDADDGLVEVAFAADADPIEFRLRYLKEPRDRAVLPAAAEEAAPRAIRT